MQPSEVSQFQHHVVNGEWEAAQRLLPALAGGAGVLQQATFLVSLCISRIALSHGICVVRSALQLFAVMVTGELREQLQFPADRAERLPLDNSVNRSAASMQRCHFTLVFTCSSRDHAGSRVHNPLNPPFLSVSTWPSIHQLYMSYV